MIHLALEDLSLSSMSLGLSCVVPELTTSPIDQENSEYTGNLDKLKSKKNCKINTFYQVQAMGTPVRIGPQQPLLVIEDN